jgi:SpoVK/Ycf46/Vps4 family AAA+-type ATPase
LKPVSFVAVPTNQREQYLKFKKKLTQTAGKLPRLKKNNAWVIGSNTTTTLELKINIDFVVNDQKQEIIDSIESVFKNPKAYTDMGLQPFRKICFSGEPGTGKTMTASAIAKLMNEKHKIKTMYVSGGGLYGSSFDLIRTALNLIKNHPSPTMLIVEEFDSFVMGMDDRAKILTFLDGLETPDLKHPLCLIATTNHAERIDPAIINRSGRINRVFWFKGIKTEREANALVNIYRGSLVLPDISNLILHRTPDFVKELLVELKWSNENGMEMSLSNISEKIRKLSSGLMYSKCEGVEFG